MSRADLLQQLLLPVTFLLVRRPAGAGLVAVLALSVLTGLVPPSRVVAAESASGTVLGFGDAAALGAPTTASGLVAVAPTPSGGGYWVASADGGVFSFGDAAFAGSAGGSRLNHPVVDVAASPTGRGYWLVAGDGGIFSYGDAAFHGSTGAVPLNQPIVGMAATPSGRGYWLVARDGGIFTFGDAAFHGSTGAVRLNQPIVSMAATPSGRGYWLVAADGGIFTFGDAVFRGSTGGTTLRRPVVDMARTPSGGGYWLAAADGGIFSFGDASFQGAGAGALPAGQAAVGLAAHPRSGYWLLASTQQVRVAMAGDVHGEGRVRTLLERGGNPLAAVAPLLTEADVATVNLETAVGSLGRPAAKQYVFQAPPSLLRAVKDAGVDVVSLANNHALDYGVEALFETLRHARAAGLATVGAGADAREAYAPAVVGAPGRRVAVVGLSHVLSPGWAAGPGRPGLASAYDQGAAVAAVRHAATLAEHVVVMIHWGIELDRCPDATQRRLASALVDAGADVVAGHHPHVLQGLQPRGRALVAFSLGNFVWYHSNPPSNATGILSATLDAGGVASHRFTPARIGSTGGPTPLGGREADEARGELASLTPGAGRC